MTWMEKQNKHIIQNSSRSMALDCLHRVIQFYLNVYASKQPRNHVWGYLHNVTSQLQAILKVLLHRMCSMTNLSTFVLL